MKNLFRIKRFINTFGYDIKRYRPFYESTIMPLAIRSILDIGANTGAYAKEMRFRFPEATIYSFEPLKDCFAELKRTMAGDEKFKCWNVVLGDAENAVTMQRSSFHPSSSLRKMAALHKKIYPKSAQTALEPIKMEKLDDIMKNIKIEEPFLVKIDVQGFEDKVILGGKNTLAKAAVVICETSFVTLYERQPLFDDVYQLLKQLGFFYYGDAGRHYSPHTKTLIYEDSVFIKQQLIRA